MIEHNRVLATIINTTPSSKPFQSEQEPLRRLSMEAHFLAKDLISYRTGNGTISRNLTARTMRRLSDELEVRHAPLLSNMCNNLNMTADSAHEKFVQVADEVFRDGVNWGRIVAVFTFGGRLAQFCARNGMQGSVGEVESWVGEYVSNLSSWIQSQGGWETFNAHFQDPNQTEKRWWTGLVLATLGIGTVATAIYQHNC